MYQDHFAVERPLFGDGVARDADVFLGPRQQLAAANLKIALSTRDSVTVISGPAGVGKTTIASYAVRAATTRLALGWLGSPPLTPHELLEQLLTGFEFTPYKSSRVERMQMWRQFLNEMSITDTRVCVLVENAEDYTTEVLRALGSLTSADPNGCPGANLVLTSAVPARELLAAPGLDTIKQRLRLSARVEPLTSAEMEGYLRQRCTLSGAQYEDVFAAGTAAALQHFSGGLLRITNNLCETALMVAATRKEAQLGPELLTRVAVGLFGMEPPAGLPAAPPSAKPTEPAAADRRHPIVGEHAVATATMMAAEASLEPVTDDDAEEASAIETLEALEPAQDFEPTREAEPAPDSELVPTVSDEVRAPTSAALSPTAVATATEDEDGGAAGATIEFVTDSVEDDPFSVDEALITDGASEAADESIDLPVLTDSVEPEADVDAYLAADEVQGDTVDQDLAEVDDGLRRDIEAEATARKREAQAALAHAKALEDISNSMAETLFGEAELAELSATLSLASTDAQDAVEHDDVALALALQGDDEEPPARSGAL